MVIAKLLSLVVVAASVVTLPSETLPASATAGNPGVPQDPTVVFADTFSDGTAATTTPLSLRNYPSAGAPRYTADDAWLPPASGNDLTQTGGCNGWIVRSTDQYTDLWAPGKYLDYGCNFASPSYNNMWVNLQAMAKALGVAQGMTASQASSNNVLSEITNRSDITQVPGMLLKSTNNLVTGAAGGRFYGVSAYFAAVNCYADDPTWRPQHIDPDLRFSLILDGTVIQLASGLNPCVAPGVSGMHTMLLNATPVLASAGTHSLGLQLYDAATGTQAGSGNDISFDLPMIRDMTPQLDQYFTPDVVTVGGTTNWVFTITNTTDLLAKNGWSFSAPIPAGLVAGTPSSDCGSPVISTTGGAITATGNLAATKKFCTVTVPVTVAANGIYTSNASDFTLNGLLPPLSATLRTTQLQLSGSVAPNPVAGPGASVDYTFTVTNTGYVPVNGIFVSRTAFSGGGTLSTITCDDVSLAVGASTTCHATYTTTAADVTAGTVNLSVQAGGNGEATGTKVPVFSNIVNIPLTVTQPLDVSKSTFTVTPAADLGDRTTWVTTSDDGTYYYTGILTARDSNNQPMIGLPTSQIHFTASPGVDITDVIDNGDGTYTVHFSSPTPTSTATASVSYGSSQIGTDKPIPFRAGDLTITETVYGLMADHTKLFTFTITLRDSANQLVSGTYQTDMGPLTFTSGVATIKLKHGDSVTIQDLPVNGYVQIHQETEPGYTVSFIDSVASGTTVDSADTGSRAMTPTRKFDFRDTRETPPPTGITAANTLVWVLPIIMCLSLVFAFNWVIPRWRRRMVTA